MIKVLFFLPTLGEGGAEKVLVNLVNHMDSQVFDITVMTLFDVGKYRDSLASHIRYCSCMKKAPKGITYLMKCVKPDVLHNILIKESYDIEIAYLEGSATRIISGCRNPDTKKIAWVHTEFPDQRFAAHAYRSFRETRHCYARFDLVACVSDQIRSRMIDMIGTDSNQTIIQHNTIDSDRICRLALEPVTDCRFKEEFNIIAVGKIIKNKGFDRLARILFRLQGDGLKAHFYIVGAGEEQNQIEDYLKNKHISDCFSFLGFKQNPYKYMKKCDLFVCSSYREGFSTAATEALILGVPVLTVDVSGMKELLGYNNDYGIVVSNDDESLFQGIKTYMTNPEIQQRYKKLAKERGRLFNCANTVTETEKILLGK